MHVLTGGLGEAVCSAVCECKDITVKKLAVQEIPRSGKAAELILFTISLKKNPIKLSKK
jgi:transketolase